MLVLTRKTNQSIMIGDEIEITVLSIVGEKVRIGISAPREVPVYRNEVYVEINGSEDPAAMLARVDENPHLRLSKSERGHQGLPV